MRYISLGSNCFWSSIALELNNKNQINIYNQIQTSLMSIGGIYYFNKRSEKNFLKKILYKLIYRIYKLFPRILIEYIFFRLCILQEFHEDQISNMEDFYIYKIFHTYIFPIFLFHKDIIVGNIKINNLGNLKKLKIISRYRLNPADVYIYADNIKNTYITRFFIRKIYKLISQINKNASFLIISKYHFSDNLLGHKIKFINLDISKCKISTSGILTTTKDIKDILCQSFDSNLSCINISEQPLYNTCFH